MLSLPRKILVAVDFSDASNAALDFALAMKAQTGATVDLLHVWQRPSYLGPELMMIGGEGPLVSFAEFTRERANGNLEALLEGLRRRGVAGIHGRIVVGRPADEILDAVKAGGYDLLAMGTQGRTGLAHLLAGSVAERCVRQAPCPVLTFRVPESAGSVSIVEPVEGQRSLAEAML